MSLPRLDSLHLLAFCCARTNQFMVPRLTALLAVLTAPDSRLTAAPTVLIAPDSRLTAVGSYCYIAQLMTVLLPFSNGMRDVSGGLTTAGDPDLIYSALENANMRLTNSSI